MRIEKTRGQGKDYPPSFFRHRTIQRTQGYRPGVGADVKDSSNWAIYEQKTQLRCFAVQGISITVHWIPVPRPPVGYTVDSAC